MRTKLFATVLLLSGLPLLAQTFGEITGRVSDPSGAGVPDSTITLTNNSTNAVRQTQSGSDGIYSFPSLAPGIYSIRTEHAGFKGAMSNNVEVQVQQTVRLDLTLEIGQTSESIEVTAAAALLQSENATVGTVVETKSITELPLNGRQYLNLVTLAPNVSNLAPPAGQAQSRQGGDRADQSISAGGNRIVYDYFTLDGVVNTDPNFNTYIVLPSIDALQEFKVQTGVYPAEFGHEATQINVLTKSGGNNYHGSLFEFVRNNDFDALPYQFTATRPGVSPFKWKARSLSPSCTTEETDSSSWPTTSGSHSGRLPKASIPCRPPPCSRATSASSEPPFTIPPPNPLNHGKRRLASSLRRLHLYSVRRRYGQRRIQLPRSEGQ
jgi:hypothetical protein